MTSINLFSNHLDFDDLAVLVGTPPATGAGETANARQKAAARRRAKESRVLPDQPYDLGKLRSLDADVRFRASRVESKRLPIDSLHAHMTLESGVLKLQPLELGLAGGELRGDVTLDARRDVIVASADMRASGVELPRLRCAYGDFGVEGGIARTRALAFDTTDTVILGEGSISLRDEGLDLVLRPRPKDVSPVSLRVPLELRGTFKDPQLSPQPGPLVARAALAAALFAIAPPAALLALIETGPGKDVGCRPEVAG